MNNKYKIRLIIQQTAGRHVEVKYLEYQDLDAALRIGKHFAQDPRLVVDVLKIDGDFVQHVFKGDN